MNWVDVPITVVLFLYSREGFRRGFMRGMVDLIGITVSLYSPLVLYMKGSRILEGLGVSQVYSGALSFLIISFTVSSIFFTTTSKVFKRTPHNLNASGLNKYLGILTGFLKGLIAVIVLIALILALPLPVKSDDVEQSYIGSPLLITAQRVTSLTSDIFGDAFQHVIEFFSIETVGDEPMDLSFTVADPEINQEAEVEMLRLVNEVRALEGLPSLVMDETLRDVARLHSVDMLQRGYMGHIDPEGNTPFDRMRDGGVSFAAAGENLALAQTVSVAHRGLMDSPGHRENILNPLYRRVGIGAAQGGRYGTMFTQKFTN